MNLNNVNLALKKIGKRNKAIQFKGTAYFTNDIEFYQLDNGKMIIVFYELGIIKSILQQITKDKKYYYQINGQDGRNTKCIYQADFNWNTNKYVDILQA